MASPKAYMPQSVQHQMQHELQRSLPAHLQQYASGNTYVPQHAQKALMEHMEKSLPAHLKQYAGEFVRQQSAAGSLAFRNQAPRPIQAAAPTANPMRHDHSLGFGQQYNVDMENPTNPGSLSYTAQYQQPNAGAEPAAAGNVYSPGPPSGSSYDFIVNSSRRPGSNWLLQAPLKTRIMVFSGGLAILLLVTWIFIALLTAGAATSAQNFTALAEEQTELSRISLTPAEHADQGATENFASTARLSLMSDTQTFMRYLTSVNAAPSPDVLSSTRSSATDAQLKTARTTGTYDQTYLSIARTQLQTYAANLKRVFNATSNARERQLLSNAYAHAQLLLALSGTS